MLLLILLLVLIYIHSTSKKTKRKESKKKKKTKKKNISKNEAIGIAAEKLEDVKIIKEIIKDREMYRVEIDKKSVDVDLETGEVSDVD